MSNLKVTNSNITSQRRREGTGMLVEHEKVNRALKELSGITMSDWIKVKAAIDMYFCHKEREAEKEIRLASAEEIHRLIRSRFG